MILSILREARSWLRPLLVALFEPGIAWALRWRLLILQPTVFITYSIGKVPYLFSRPFTVEYLLISPERPHVRVLVFKSEVAAGTGRGLRPLHVDIHGGAFIGGLPENFAPFCSRVAKETGAVVVSITYRYAPEHTFPVAIDDVDATIRWMRDHAQERWGADPTLMTISGSSAGANLAFAAMQQPECHGPSPTAIKASASFYAVMEQRISPWEKPRPAKMPKSDPTAVLMPLFDAYPAKARRAHMNDPRLSPVLANRETLPRRMLMVIAAIDILVEEQMSLVERVREEDLRDSSMEGQQRIGVVVEEDGFHGYLEREYLISNMADHHTVCV